MSREEFDKLLERYLKNKSTLTEKKLIDQWYAEMTHSNWDIEEFQLDEIGENLWSSIERNIQETPEIEVKHLPERKRRLNYWAISGIAASLLIIATGIFFYETVLNYESGADSPDPSLSRHTENAVPNNRIVVRNDNSNTVRPVSLPDGSIVILQPRSEIHFEGTFDSVREITLIGEAFFEIAKDPQRPFLVHSGDLITKVLGTSFNVRARTGDNNIIVDVKTGKVEVFQKRNNKTDDGIYHLTPNQQAIYDLKSGTITQKLQDDPQVIITEKEVDEMHFDEAPAATVFAAIEKAYGVELDFDHNTFEECYLTTRIAHESLYTKLQIICTALGATYKVEGTRIIIQGNGCE